jgi:hypothetical protein
VPIFPGMMQGDMRQSSCVIVIVTLPCIYLLADSCHRSHSQTWRYP